MCVLPVLQVNIFWKSVCGGKRTTHNTNEHEFRIGRYGSGAAIRIRYESNTIKLRITHIREYEPSSPIRIRYESNTNTIRIRYEVSYPWSRFCRFLRKLSVIYIYIYVTCVLRINMTRFAFLHRSMNHNELLERVFGRSGFSNTSQKTLAARQANVHIRK